MRADNFIVKGKFFSASGKDSLAENLKNTKDMIISYMTQNDYNFTGPSSFGYNFLEMTFKLDLGERTFKESFFKSILGKSRHDQISEFYFKKIKTKRTDIPYIIKIHIFPHRIKDKVEGLSIEITSKPVIYYRITQLNEQFSLDEENYSFITHENKDFLDSLGKALGFHCLEEPKSLRVYIKTATADKLRKFELEKIAEILTEGKSKIEIGQEGISNLWKVIEHFLQETVRLIGERPAGLENPENNLNILKNKGYLSKEMLESLRFIIHKGTYSRLKERDHQDKSLDYFDISFLYSVTEEVINYLLDKIIKNRIKINFEEKKEEIGDKK